MMWLSNETEWLASRVDKWVAQCQGYSKLRSCRLSRGYQTMLVKPDPCKMFWTRADSAVLNDEIDTSCAIPEINPAFYQSKKSADSFNELDAVSGDVSVEKFNSETQLDDKAQKTDEISDETLQHSQSLRELNCPSNFRLSSAPTFYPRVAPARPKKLTTPKNSKHPTNINKYRASDPVINVNDNFIEIIQENGYENSFTPAAKTRNLKKEDIYKNYNIYNTTDLSPISYNAKYSKFLTKTENANNWLNSRKVSNNSKNINKNYAACRFEDNNNNVRATSESRVDILQDEINYSEIFKKCKPRRKSTSLVTELDEHRVLRQSGGRQSVEDLSESESPKTNKLNWFFGDQSLNAQNQDRQSVKKQVVVGKNGLHGPVWPAVLLTYDRNISLASDL